ncbi:nephrocystin-3 isoform X3 [Punica granatum]|uniref:Nephrocystin-3 isoform X3 n=1 Tax=Punica granatum TaxID=22663 RepID=A0A6P8DAA4_PUNGR|nr:nephrocystin-3 isoform X3 [Punica granatum]
MATSPLQPPLTIHKFRTTIQFFPSFSSTHFPRSVFDAKVLAVRTKVACRPGTIKAFAAVRSAETGVVHRRENGSRTSQSFEKSGTLLDDLAEPLDAGSGFERDLQGLFDEVKRMIASGKENDAVDLLQANFQAVKVQMEDGAKGIEEVATLDIIALGYMALGDLKAVALILEKMNEVAGSLRDDENLLGSVVMHMGSMYSALGKFEKSVLMYQRAVGILEGIYGKDSTFLVTPLLGMAKALGCIGRATKATRTYQHAVAILESSRGVESEDLVVPLLALGNLLIKEGKANDAEYQFTRFVSTLIFTGDVEEAIYAYRKALQIMKDSNYVALDDSVMERMRIDLAELLHVVGRGDEGRQLLEECLLITEEQKGKDHPSFVNHLVNLATSYSRSKNYAEAERLLRAALGIMTRTLGPDDQSISFPMLHLAVALYNLKRDEEAEQLAVDVIRIREKAFGEDSLPVGEALDCLVSIRARLGKQDGDLVALLKRVLRIQEEGFGYESEEVMVTLKKILFYLDKLGRKDEKFGLQKRLSVLKERYKHMIQY